MNTSFNQKKVIVTGGAGFIGSHITEELVKQGARVLVIDDLSAGSLKNLEGISACEMEFIRGSITDIALLRKHLAGAEYVFHHAAIASVTSSIDQPLASHEANLTGTLNVLQACRENGIRKVVCASSCAIYGDEPTLPKVEEMAPAPRSPYAVTKLAMEYYCRVFQEIYGLKTVCLRYFNVFGPRQDPYSDYAAVIPKFIRIAGAGKPLHITGDGKQTRDFIYIKDVVAANLLAAESEATGIYNIGSGESTSINTLAGVIIRLSGKRLETVYGRPRPGDIIHSRADISRARSFGFSPRFDLESGLRTSFEYYSAAQREKQA